VITVMIKSDCSVADDIAAGRKIDLLGVGTITIIDDLLTLIHKFY
jgi:DNA polymerase III alpha subunit